MTNQQNSLSYHACLERLANEMYQVQEKRITTHKPISWRSEEKILQMPVRTACNSNGKND